MKRVTEKEWFLDRYCGQQFAALVEEGELKEFHVEEEIEDTRLKENSLLTKVPEKAQGDEIQDIPT